jgi:hypothetical protein
MMAPLGRDAGDPGAPTTQRENVDDIPPWEAMSEIQEHKTLRPSHVVVCMMLFKAELNLSSIGVFSSLL